MGCRPPDDWLLSYLLPAKANAGIGYKRWVKALLPGRDSGSFSAYSPRGLAGRRWLYRSFCAGFGRAWLLILKSPSKGAESCCHCFCNSSQLAHFKLQLGNTFALFVNNTPQLNYDFSKLGNQLVFSIHLPSNLLKFNPYIQNRSLQNLSTFPQKLTDFFPPKSTISKTPAQG